MYNGTRFYRITLNVFVDLYVVAMTYFICAHINANNLNDSRDILYFDFIFEIEHTNEDRR